MRPSSDSPLALLLSQLPNAPGVYVMRDCEKRVLYIGKAKHLRHRVRSYFVPTPSDDRPFVQDLGHLVASIETILTQDEQEALQLETTLIHQHRPRFNRKVADDPDPWLLRINTQVSYPRVEMVHQVEQDGALYFGPYTHGSACSKTADTLNRYFKLRTCSDEVMERQRRPCWQYHIKRCHAPCVFPVSPVQYQEQVVEATRFLTGQNEGLVQTLRTHMEQAVVQQAYERAAVLRDQLECVQKSPPMQPVDLRQWRAQDAFGFCQHAEGGTWVVLFFRQGRLQGRRVFHGHVGSLAKEEALVGFVTWYYQTYHAVPDEILLPMNIRPPLQQQRVAMRKRACVRGCLWVMPKRGPKKQRVELAMQNAASAHRAALSLGQAFPQVPFLPQKAAA